MKKTKWEKEVDRQFYSMPKSYQKDWEDLRHKIMKR